MADPRNDTRHNRAYTFLRKFNESDTAAELPLDTKLRAFKDAEHSEALKEAEGNSES